MRITLLAIFTLFLSSLGFAQSRMLSFELAEKAFAKKDYATALHYYKISIDDTTKLESVVNPYEITLTNLNNKKLTDSTIKSKDMSEKDFDYLLHQIATCYQKTYDYPRAVQFFKQSTQRYKYRDDMYNYGYALMQVKKYNEAIDVFESYVGQKEKNDSLARLAQNHMSSCYYALDDKNVHQTIVVTEMDTVLFNAGTSNFAPMYFGGPNKLIITSARKGGILNNPDKQDSRYLCDLYQTHLTDTGWCKAEDFGRPVNSGLHDGSGCMSVDGIMFYTRWKDDNHNESFIYMAKEFNGRFFEAMKLNQNINLTGYRTQNPFISFDGSRLYFSSNRPGGKGGMDLWVCEINESGATSEPTNLGEPINTVGDEISPFFHTISSTLYFASNGHVGVGGLDIFKSSYDAENKVFDIPKNMGLPINSNYDDAYLILDRVQQHGFFSSDRQPCPDGHCYDIYEFKNEVITVDISGTVYDSETNEPIPSALVTMRNVHDDEEPVMLITDEKGYYSSELKLDKDYFFKAQKNKYFADAASVTTQGITETTHLEKDFFLNKIPSGDITIEGIEYDLNKATLRPKSLEILDKIYDMMVLNNNIHIEINSHTDTRGSDVYNMKLSAARAKSCVDYLIKKGIVKDRIHSEGLGETKPLITDEEIAKMATEEEKEAAHQHNRRTSFKVTKDGVLQAGSTNQ